MKKLIFLALLSGLLLAAALRCFYLAGKVKGAADTRIEFSRAYWIGYRVAVDSVRAGK